MTRNRIGIVGVVELWDKLHNQLRAEFPAKKDSLVVLDTDQILGSTLFARLVVSQFAIGEEQGDDGKAKYLAALRRWIVAVRLRPLPVTSAPRSPAASVRTARG